MSHASPLRSSVAVVLLLCVIVGVGVSSAQQAAPPDLKEEPTLPAPTPTETWIWDPPPRTLTISSAQVALGEVFELAVVDTDRCGGDLYLRFDPTALQIVDAAGNPATQAVIPPFSGFYVIRANTVDNANGNIHVDVYYTSTMPRSLICILRFKALAERASTTVTMIGGCLYNPGTEHPWGSFGIVPGIVSVGPPNTATPTPSPATATPTATPRPDQRMIHGAVRDLADQPVPGAVLTLERDAGEWVAQASGPSGGDGAFRLWSNPIPGDYRLRIEPPPGYAVVSADAPPSLSSEQPGTLYLTLDDSADAVGPFEYVLYQEPTPAPTLPAAPIEGYVWIDGHGGNPLDGARQPGEGLAGVVVSLDGAPGPSSLSVLQRTTTDAEGYFSFTVGAGEYVVAIHDPLGRVPDTEESVVADEIPEDPIDWSWHLVRLPMLVAAK